MGTNLKIVAVVIFTLFFYTLVANSIPQVESEVPEKLDLSAGVTTEALVAAGERLYNGAGGCTACHGLGTRAPNLLTSEAGLGAIGARCGERVQGMGCKEYLYESMTEPGEYLVEGFNPIMPDMRRVLSEDQIWAVVAYLQSVGGEVTVTADDIGASSSDETPDDAGGGAPAAPATKDPQELMTNLGCFGCHQLAGQGTALGPPLDGVGARRDADYIRESILDPGAEVTPGYEPMAALMPRVFGDQLTAAQLEALVQYLAAQR